MTEYKKTRDEASEALIALRVAMGKTQAEFAVEILKTAVTTIARYETSHRPPGEVLLRLAEIAREHGLAELSSKFEALYLEDVLKRFGSRLTIIPATETETARGYLVRFLSGPQAIRGAHAFMGVIPQLDSDDAKVKQKAVSALAVLQRTRREFEGPASSGLHEMMLSASLGAPHPPPERENKGDATASSSSGHHVTAHPRGNPEPKQGQAPAMRKAASRKKGR